MVSASNIEIPVPRFISREELEQIKDRYQRLPPGNYISDGNDIICQFIDHKLDIINKPIVNVIYPGLQDLFLHLKNDLEKLILHIEEADKENDRLLAMLSPDDTWVAEREEESDEASGD